MVRVIGRHHYKWLTFTWKINVTVKRLNTLQFINLKIITVWVCERNVTPFMNEVFSLLKFMQSLVMLQHIWNLIKGSTHTLWTERSLSLELIYYGHFVWLGLWSEGGRILANLIKELKLCACLFAGNISMCHYLRASNDLSLGVW